MTTPMPSDPPRELAAHERELSRRDQRAPIWLDVVTGATDPAAVTAAQAGHVDDQQLARDRALFRPLDAELRARLIDKLAADPSPRSWRGPILIGVLAAAAIVPLVVVPLVRDAPVSAVPDIVPFLRSDITAELTVIGGIARARSTPSAPEPGPRLLRLGQEFLLEVRLSEPAFDLAQIVAHCHESSGERELVVRHRVVTQDRGYIKASISPDKDLGPRCHLEIQVRIADEVRRVPREQWPEIEFVA